MSSDPIVLFLQGLLTAGFRRALEEDVDIRLVEADCVVKCTTIEPDMRPNSSHPVSTMRVTERICEWKRVHQFLEILNVGTSLQTPLNVDAIVRRLHRRPAERGSERAMVRSPIVRCRRIDDHPGGIHLVFSVEIPDLAGEETSSH